ncbi:hypothetical protein Tco_0784684 [Tanacetum coccineum]
MSTSNQQTLTDSGANERPPMLEKGNYIPWESRFRRFLDNKLEEGDRMWHLIEKGPYVRSMIPNLDKPTEQILEPLSKMTEGNKKQYIVDVRERIKRFMFGSDVTNHVRHSLLMDEFDKFAAKEGESLESMYERLTTLVNIIDCNNVRPILVSINTKFLNCLQPEWSKLSKEKKAAKNHDPLALLAHSSASSSQSHANSSYSPQPYYVTHPSLVADYEDEYQGELQGDSQEDKLTTDVMLLAGAITKKNAGRQNRNQAFKAGTGNDESNQIIQRVPQTKSNPRKANVQCYNYNEKGHYAPDDNVASEPSYDAKVVSEVNASTRVHEQVNRVQHKIIIHTSDDDQIDSSIIFDDPYVENKGGTFEHDSTAHDEYHNIKMMAYNLKRLSKKRENRYLEDICDLEEKLNSHDRIVYKMGQSIQIIHMLGKEPNNVYDPFLKAGLGYKNPERLKKAIAAQPKMYDGAMLHCTSFKIDSPDSEETLEDREEKSIENEKQNG